MIPEQHIETSFREMYSYRHQPEQKRIIADFFWRILLSASVLIVILFVVYGTYQLLKVLRDSAVSAENAGPVKQSLRPLTRKQLERTLSEFQARQMVFESLKTNAPAISDPSK